jgi:apolipoprotein N-acyltransferase
MKFWFGLGLALLSGLLLILAFPPVGFSWLMWVAFVPAYYALQKLAKPGWQAGLISALPYLVWLEVFFYGMWPDVLWFNLLPPAVALLLFIVAYFRKPVNGEGWTWYPLMMAAQAVVLEWIRSLTPLGVWGIYGFTQYANPTLIQIASLAGVWALSFALIFVNATIALVLVNGFNHRAARFNGALVLLMLVGISAFGLVRLGGAQSAGQVKVALVQHGQPEPNELVFLNATNEPIRPALARKDFVTAGHWYLDQLQGLTAEAAAQHPDLIIWPEGMLGLDPTQHPEIEARIKQIAQAAKAYLVVPYASPDRAADPHLNMLSLYGPDGARIGAYQKQHITYNATTTAKGEAVYPHFPVSTPGLPEKLRLATMICFDADFMDTTANLVKNGAQLIAAPSDDFNWAIGWRHFMHIPIQAVQHGVAIAKTDNGWVSLAADPWGRVVAQTDHWQTSRRILNVELPVLAESGTFFTQHGDWFVYLCMGLYALTLVLERRAASRSRKTATAQLATASHNA